MSSVSSGPPPATSDGQRRVIHALSTAVIAVDTEIRRQNEAVNAHNSLVTDLADEVVTAVANDPDYRIPDHTRRALGDEFYAGPLLSAAARANLLTVDPDGRDFVLTEAGRQVDVIDRIMRAGAS